MIGTNLHPILLIQQHLIDTCDMKLTTCQKRQGLFPERSFDPPAQSQDTAVHIRTWMNYINL